MKPKSLFILAILALGIFSYVYFAIEKPAKEKELSGGKEDRLAPGNLESIQSIKIAVADKKIELKREKIGWRVIAPVQDLASQSKVENLIAALGKLKKTRVLFSPTDPLFKTADLSQYGLKTPKVVVEYKTSDLTDQVVLELGNQNPSGSASYAKTRKDGVVLGTMELDYLGTQSPDDFREMRFTTVAASDFEEVQLEDGKAKMKFKRNSDETWSMLQPYTLPLDQDFTKSFIDKIGFVRANQFLPATPASLAKPDIRILVGFKKDAKDLRTTESDTRPQGLELLLSKTKKGKEFEYYAKADKTTSGTIAQFHYDNFTKAPEDFISKTFDTFLTASVQKITISKPKKPDLVISRTEKGYSAATGKDSFIPESNKVDKLVDSLRNMRASRFLELSKGTKRLSSMTVSLDLKDNKHLTFSFEFTKDSSLLWKTEGDQALKYALQKDIVAVKDFEAEALKPAAATPPDSGKKAL